VTVKLVKEKEIFNLLQQLVEIPGPVGREEAVQKYLRSKWDSYGFKTEIDRIGNLYGHLNGKGQHWAVVSHADTIGFLVQQMLSNGFLKMSFNTAATTPDARFLAGTTIKFLTEGHQTRGYFGLRSGHLAGIEGKKLPVLFDDLFVDLGVNSAEEAKSLGIDIGTSAVFDTPLQRFQDNIVGPSLDNRVGSLIQTILAESIGNLENSPKITLISTVQEEIGMKGASSAADYSTFDAVINLDVGLTGDIPSSHNDFLPTQLGSGPILVVKDFSVHYSFPLLTFIEKQAVNSGIPIQKAVYRNYNTDGMHFFMRGHPTVTIGIPCRYTHTDFETVRFMDIEHTLDLLMKLISSN
jgi:putative aminopeptidase FrvX